ncbi:hypothetical protein [Bordetella genomosp. 9]|uniref:Uncharacterized protein n=1 Tax=Bordetella genomosp. 9 TaxID=1416803 RepID=A0A1W6YZ57_9BORD|nr:hypothetical protein [Bordetella genomosp. 9]ARP86271.1 hypothetical protein CAL13_08715 [Bordetella genomosp. 9]
MSIPPDFTRRVQENPQIAVYMAMRIESMRIAAQDMIHQLDDMKRICSGIHYTELARQAAESVRCVPGMES